MTDNVGRAASEKEERHTGKFVVGALIGVAIG